MGGVKLEASPTKSDLGITSKSRMSLGYLERSPFIFIVFLFIFIIFGVNAQDGLSFNISLSSKPFVFNQYLIIPEKNNKIFFFNKDFSIVKTVEVGYKNYYLINQQNLEIYSLEKDGSISFCRIDSELYEQSIKNIRKIPDFKDGFFIRSDLVFYNGGIYDVKNSKVINLQVNGVRYVTADDKFVFVVDHYDKLNVFSKNDGNIIGKYNLGANVSGIVFIDENHFAVASVKGLYIISKNDFKIQRKRDFPKTPRGLYFYYPYIVVPTIEKIYVYNYLTDVFVAFKYSKITNDYWYDSEDYAFYDYDKNLSYFTVDTFTSENNFDILYFDFCLFGDKLYFINSRRQMFNVDYRVYDYRKKKGRSFSRTFYTRIGEFLIVDTDNWAFSNQIFEFAKTRYIYNFSHSNFPINGYLVVFNENLYWFRVYRDYFTVVPVARLVYYQK